MEPKAFALRITRVEAFKYWDYWDRVDNVDWEEFNTLTEVDARTKALTAQGAKVRCYQWIA